ncbi:GNAT family N-acetyltransferase [Planktomarina temperata]|nr:GNAT family N-acetyltransferase [Planktomarina temperata]
MTANKTAVVKIIVDFMLKKHDNFLFDLYPNVYDVRPFSWYNHAVSDDKLRVTPRYTALLDTNQLNDLGTYLRTLSKGRRSELNKHADYEIFESNQIDTFCEIYLDMFQRQNICISDQQLENINRIISVSTKMKFGKLLGIKHNNKFSSMCLFLHDADKAYYLFGANNPSDRHLGLSSILLLKAFLFLKNMGISTVDLVGANSPDRGGYKLSFGSKLTHYHQVSKNA